jgi:nitric oxide reductase subunit B
MDTLVWMRVPGDIVVGIAAVVLALFLFRLLVGGRREAIVDPALVPAE